MPACPQDDGIICSLLCYNSCVMLDTFLVPEKTVVKAKGDGPAVEVRGASSRVFLLTLSIEDVVEQESLDVGIFGSMDGNAWPSKPLETFPQKFYRGQHPMLLDLSQTPDIKFVRAHWEVNRWGRGDGRVRPSPPSCPSRPSCLSCPADQFVDRRAPFM